MALASAFFHVIETPVGALFIGGSERGIHRLDFLPDARRSAGSEGHRVRELERSRERLERETGLPAAHDPERAGEAARQMREYFAGTRVTFDLPLAPHGSEFQRKVWATLMEIAPGETRSYGWVAGRIGQPSASRAVGAANGQNPIVIVVPCHRVVGANGTLTGYGGGLHRKRWLLEHETSSLPLFASAGRP
ncbi:MAG: methylated-DNA--[protein]-cysteine S-methyltransferase [Dehalococcoidia bacterium]|nr:methylated-DNA--[protein]-cysteine S-methyltransferase [Dehalococcoidia bacterium]